MIFSFYPTKPISSCDGGMVVSDDKDTIDYFKTMTMNGTNLDKNSWQEHKKYPDIKCILILYRRILLCKTLKN